MNVKQTPIRAPISESLSASELIMGARRLTSENTLRLWDSDERDQGHSQAPEKNPYNIAKTMVPAILFIASEQNMRMDVM